MTEVVIGITGATGFVGRALQAALAHEGYGDIRLFGRTERTVDTLKVEALSGREALSGVDILFHVAGLSDPRAPAEALHRANVGLAIDTASAAARAGVKHLVFFSSLGVHGKASDAPVSPDSPFAPTNVYGWTKAAAEEALRRLCVEARMRLTILRPPVIYGPGSKSSVDALAKLVRIGAPLPVGRANAPRSLCSIENVVSASLAVVRSDRRGPDVFLPCDPQDFSASALSVRLKEILGSGSLLAPVPPPSMKVLLSLVGRREMYSSLFESLVIERSHWADWDWRPSPVDRALDYLRATS